MTFSLFAPPPTSRKFAGSATRELDDVHCRHRKPCATGKPRWPVASAIQAGPRVSGITLTWRSSGKSTRRTSRSERPVSFRDREANPRKSRAPLRRASSGSLDLEAASLEGVTVSVGSAGSPRPFGPVSMGTGQDRDLGSSIDALPAIGHACGHNLIAAGALGAFIALHSERHALRGTIDLVGTPAEEGGGGKSCCCVRACFAIARLP